MKKILAILLFFVFVFEYAGSFLVLKMAQYSHYDYMKKELRRNKKYIILCFSEKEYARYKVAGKDEVKVEGRMYDYDYMESYSDSLRLYCVRDYKEEFMLNQFFKKTIRNTDRSDRETSNSQSSFWLTLLYILPDSLTVNPTNEDFSLSNTPLFEKEKLGILRIPSPPPRKS